MKVIKSVRRQKGITLLEVLLSMAIIGTILYLALQQYQSFRMYQDAQQVRSNVDLIMEAMGSYYKANCMGQPPTWGTLNPFNAADPLDNNPVAININTDLIENGYLSLVFPPNTFVDTTVGQHGYIAQFNLTNTDRNICTTSFPCAATDLVSAGHIISWKAQVSVKLVHAADAPEYRNYLGADCAATTVTSGTNGSTVVTCSTGAVAGSANYLVWQRNPSLGSMTKNTPFWMNNPVVTQFSQQQRTYPVQYLMGTVGMNGKIPVGTSTNTWAGTQYFLCGD